MEVTAEGAVALWLFTRRMKKKKKNEIKRRKHRYWVHPILQTRKTDGAFYKFYNDLREYDDKFFNYTRMSQNSFDELLGKIRQRITWKTTNMRPCIDPEEKHDAWRRIQEKMGEEFSIEILKKKKDSLLASFRIAGRRAKSSCKSGAGASEVYKPIWFAYTKMASFLNDKDEPRSTMDSENIEDPLQAPSEIMISDNVEGTSSALSLEADTVANQENNSPTTPHNSSRKYSAKRKKSTESQDSLNQELDDAYATLQAIKQRKERDYCDKYKDVVASRLRQLDDWQRDCAINQIDNILFEHKRAYLVQLENSSSKSDQLPKEPEKRVPATGEQDVSQTNNSFHLTDYLSL